jgi:hypothetical protein
MRRLLDWLLELGVKAKRLDDDGPPTSAEERVIIEEIVFPKNWHC